MTKKEIDKLIEETDKEIDRIINKTNNNMITVLLGFLIVSGGLAIMIYL